MPDWGDPVRDQGEGQRADALIQHAGRITLQSWKGRSWTEVMRFTSQWVLSFAGTHGSKMALGALAGYGVGQVAGAAISGAPLAAEYLARQSPELLRTLGDSAVQNAYAAWQMSPGLPEFIKKIGNDYGTGLLANVQEYFAEKFANESAEETLGLMLKAGWEGRSGNQGILAEVRKSLTDYWYRQRLQGGTDFPQKVTAILEAISAAGKLHAQVKDVLENPSKLQYCDDVVALADGINQMIALRSDAMTQIIHLQDFLGEVQRHFANSNYIPFDYDQFDREMNSAEEDRIKLFAQEADLIRGLNAHLTAVTVSFLQRSDVNHKLHRRVNLYKAVQSCSKEHCFGPKGEGWF